MKKPNNIEERRRNEKGVKPLLEDILVPVNDARFLLTTGIMVILGCFMVLSIFSIVGGIPLKTLLYIGLVIVLYIIQRKFYVERNAKRTKQNETVITS